MAPDFNKATIEALGKRAGYLCSNPDCRTPTVGPNSNPSGTTSIGEAAHISGARPRSARYRRGSNDVLRADITNGIWLCRNCHKMVDNDEKRHTENLLLQWREQHERFVSERLGKPGEDLQRRLLEEELEPFLDKPPFVRRLLIDKPQGWEWRLTAELLRHHNTEIFENLDDLNSGRYLRQLSFLDEASAIVWIDQKISEMQEIFGPVDGLLKRLTNSWGEPGEPADVRALNRSVVLIHDWLAHVLKFEESIRFTKLPENFQKVHELLEDIVGSQARKLEALPAELDQMVAMIGTDHGGTLEKPLIIKKTIEVVLPDRWSENFNREYQRATGTYIGLQQAEAKKIVRPFAWLYFMIFFFVTFFVVSSFLSSIP